MSEKRRNTIRKAIAKKDSFILKEISKEELTEYIEESQTRLFSRLQRVLETV